MDEFIRSGRHSCSCGVFFQVRLALFPGQQIAATIGKRLGAGYEKIAGLQVISNIGRQADF